MRTERSIRMPSRLVQTANAQCQPFADRGLLAFFGEKSQIRFGRPVPLPEPLELGRTGRLSGRRRELRPKPRHADEDAEHGEYRESACRAHAPPLRSGDVAMIPAACRRRQTSSAIVTKRIQYDCQVYPSRRAADMFRFHTVLLICAFADGVMVVRESGRSERSLNGQWEFRRDGVPDNAWKPVAVPSVFQEHEGNDWHGVGWYRKTKIDAVEPAARPPSVASFRRRRHACRSLVERPRLGEHLGGWTPFRFDVTELDSREPPPGRTRSASASTKRSATTRRASCRSFSRTSADSGKASN